MTDSDKESRHFSVSLARHRSYQFQVDFQERDLPALTLDEPPPLGEGRGPNASRVLAAAVGDCLSASLLYCLERAKIPVSDFEATVEGELVRNERGRMRIGGLRVSGQRQGRAHQRVVFADIHIEIDGRDQERGRGVVLEIDGPGCGFAHGKMPGSCAEGASLPEPLPRTRKSSIVKGSRGEWSLACAGSIRFC